MPLLILSLPRPRRAARRAAAAVADTADADAA
jgi:hypothetical protein